MKRLIASLMLLSLAPAVTRAEEAVTSKDLQIDQISVGTAVENKELTGTASDFDASITRVYCWTKIAAANPPAKIKHIWYADDKKEAEVPLDINYASMRTWSSKNVWPGRWKVDITDAVGSVLSSVEFTIKGAAGTEISQ